MLGIGSLGLRRYGGAPRRVEYVLGDNAGDIPGGATFLTLSNTGGIDNYPWGHFSVGHDGTTLQFQGLGKFRYLPTAMAGKNVVAAQLELASGEYRAISGHPGGLPITVTRVLPTWVARQEPQYWKVGWNVRGSPANEDSSLPWNTPGAQGVGTDRAATPSATFTVQGTDPYGTVRVISSPQLLADIRDMIANPVANNGWVFSVDPAALFAGSGAFFHHLSEEADGSNETLVPNAVNLRPRLRLWCTN